MINEVSTDVQPHFGDEATRSLCRSRGGSNPGHGSWPDGSGRCRWPCCLKISKVTESKVTG